MMTNQPFLEVSLPSTISEMNSDSQMEMKGFTFTIMTSLLVSIEIPDLATQEQIMKRSNGLI